MEAAAFNYVHEVKIVSFCFKRGDCVKGKLAGKSGFVVVPRHTSFIFV